MNTIELINVKKESIKIEMPEEKTIYSVTMAKDHLHHVLNIDKKTNDFKIIFKGSILKDDDNLNDSKFYKEKMVYMKITRPKPLEETKTQETPTPVPVIETKAPGPVRETKTVEPVENKNITDPLTPEGVAHSLLYTSIISVLSSPDVFLECVLADPKYKNLVQRDNTVINKIMKASFVSSVCKEVSKILNTEIKHVVEELPDVNSLEEWIETLPDDQQEMLEQFTESEKKDILTLTIMKFDFYEIIQIYLACGKNMELTIETLSTLT